MIGRRGFLETLLALVLAPIVSLKRDAARLRMPPVRMLVSVDGSVPREMILRGGTIPELHADAKALFPKSETLAGWYADMRYDFPIFYSSRLSYPKLKANVWTVGPPITEAHVRAVWKISAD